MLVQSALVASHSKEHARHKSEAKREYAANYRKPPVHTSFKTGQSGNPRGRPKKNLPGLLVAALDEPVLDVQFHRESVMISQIDVGMPLISAVPSALRSPL
jgi:hypothetical protein